MDIKVGDTFTWKRTFHEKDIIQFTGVSGDRGEHHTEHDDQGRLMVQGLLTATIPTKLGGDLNYIAREMNMEFIRPVFSGDTIQCKMTITDVGPGEGLIKVAAVSVCRNQEGKEVLRSRFKGIIRQ